MATKKQPETKKVVTSKIETTKEVKQPETKKPTRPKKVKFKKLIKGAFGYNGKVYKEDFELDSKELDNPRLKRALELKMIAKI